MAKKQTKKMVPYSEVQDKVAQKRGRDVSQGRLQQIDELHSLINTVPGYKYVPHPLRDKAKGKPKTSGRKRRK